MDELGDSEIDSNRIFDINVFNGRSGYSALYSMTMLIVQPPAFCFLDDFVDVCVVCEWSVGVQVEVTNFRAVYDYMTSPTRVTIHVKA